MRNGWGCVLVEGSGAWSYSMGDAEVKNMEEEEEEEGEEEKKRCPLS